MPVMRASDRLQRAAHGGEVCESLGNAIFAEVGEQ
jgi:hypothetical protein